MNRPRALALVLALAGALGLVVAWRPGLKPALGHCPDGGILGLGADGVVGCDQTGLVPAGQALTLRQKFDCNTATAADFAQIPGVGPELALELVAARGGGFVSWDQVDAVRGVGPSRLTALQAACDIHIADAGVW